jgi:hypothetical protein
MVIIDQFSSIEKVLDVDADPDKGKHRAQCH